MERSRAENEGQREDLSKQGPTIKKAIFCLVAVRARGTTKSPLEADRRDRRPEQAEDQDKELQEIRRRVTKNTMPDNGGGPILCSCFTILFDV